MGGVRRGKRRLLSGGGCWRCCRNSRYAGFGWLFYGLGVGEGRCRFLGAARGGGLGGGRVGVVVVEGGVRLCHVIRS